VKRIAPFFSAHYGALRLRSSQRKIITPRVKRGKMLISISVTAVAGTGLSFT
jgi:hypothetical protein